MFKHFPYGMIGIIAIVFIAIAFILGMSDNRRNGIAECKLRLRGAHSVQDSIDVIDKDGFCNNALK